MTPTQRKSKKWKWIYGLSATILFLCTVCEGLNRLLQPPRRDFQIRELLIDETAFPPGWRAQPPRRPSSAPLGGQTSIERIFRSFYTIGPSTNGVAVEEIHRYWSVGDAAREFERVMPIEFRKGEHWSPWTLPQGFHYTSPYANRIRIGCARKTWQGVSTEYCRMVGQYEEYIVRFSTKISPKYMTYKDFERVVRAIDERMGHYLGKGTPQPTP